jgi:hypothetical protein
LDLTATQDEIECKTALLLESSKIAKRETSQNPNIANMVAPLSPNTPNTTDDHPRLK